MPNYVSLLRGINVGGRNKVKMDLLKETYVRLGFENVETYLQTGNVMFSSRLRSLPKVRQAIEKQILEDFGLEVSVIILTTGQLKEIFDNCPFDDPNKYPPNRVGFCFLDGETDLGELEGGEPGNLAHLESKHLYIFIPGGFGKTKWTNGFIEKKTRCISTARNWNTVQKLVQWPWK